MKKISEFQSVEEEKAYWEARGPLAEGHKGRINKPGQRRSSFLAVRLTGEELGKLRDIAAKQGLGPSTFARLLLSAVIKCEGKVPNLITSDELRGIIKALIKEVILEYQLSEKLGDEKGYSG